MPEPRTVVVIDDEPSMGHLIRRVLERDTVHVCVDGHAALTLLSALSPDVILCDLMLPGLDGPAIFQWLQQERPALADRVLFISGGATTISHQRFVRQTRRPILAKPFRLQELLSALAEVAA